TVQPAIVSSGDVDNDGIADLLAAQATAPYLLSVYVTQKGNGLLPQPKAYSLDSAAVSVLVDDLNGDGHNDIAACLSGGNIAVLLNDHHGSFFPAQAVATGGACKSLGA